MGLSPEEIKLEVKEQFLKLKEEKQHEEDIE